MLRQVILRDASTSEWLTFSEPVDVLSANSPKEILAVLSEIERRVNEDELYAAGFICYEAAPGFDAAFATHSGCQLPLLCFGWSQFIAIAIDAPFAAYPEFENHVIISASPELFFRLNGEHLSCKPMKGTAGRGRTSSEDITRRDDLYRSVKNRAENVMITDMLRSDIGRIAFAGSVNVPTLLEVEKYQTVWQMTSTISACTDASITEIFRALFPCASVTGAPKVSSMKIIAALETSARGIYTGAIGYFLLEQHLRRMHASAGYFDFKFHRNSVEGALLSPVQDMADESHRIRLLLQQNGQFRISDSIVTPGRAGAEIRVTLSTEPVDQNNPFLYHKTTRRTFMTKRSGRFQTGMVIGKRRDQRAENSSR